MRLFLLSLILCAVGCGEVPVAQDLNQTQANEIVALLNASGIGAYAERGAGARAQYTVDVKKSHYSSAVALLHKNGLPGKPKETFADLIARKGLIPDSREVEALRLDHAIAVQLEEMLENHPQIVRARVVVRLNFLSKESKPSVATLIQTSPGKAIQEAEMKQIISRAVPDVELDSIRIDMHDARENSGIGKTEGVVNEKGEVIRVPLVRILFGWRVPEEDYHGFAFTLLGFIVITGCLGAVVGYWCGFIQQSRQEYEPELPDLRPKSLKFERPTKDLPEV